MNHARLDSSSSVAFHYAIHTSARCLEIIIFVKIPHPRSASHAFLVPLERGEGLGYALLRDDHHLKTITNLDMPLDRACKGVPYQILNVVPW